MKRIGALLVMGVLFIFGGNLALADNQFTYYASGNLESYYDEGSRQLYTFADEDYYNYLNLHPGAHGRGRLIGYERRNQDETTADFREFDYFGSTLSLKERSKSSLAKRKYCA